VRDLAGSVVMPMKQLKGFSKVTVPAYGSTLAEISVPVSELGLYDMNMRYVVEPGDFDFMIALLLSVFVSRRLFMWEKWTLRQKEFLPQLLRKRKRLGPARR